MFRTLHVVVLLLVVVAINTAPALARQSLWAKEYERARRAGLFEQRNQEAECARTSCALGDKKPSTATYEELRCMNAAIKDCNAATKPLPQPESPHPLKGR